jgi:hypothetical protein
MYFRKAEMLNYFNEKKDKSDGEGGSSPEGLQHLFAPGAPGTRDIHSFFERFS